MMDTINKTTKDKSRYTNNEYDPIRKVNLSIVDVRIVIVLEKKQYEHR
jgi:hypothetical protein